MTGSLALVTGPTAEPITLEDTKAFAHVTNDDDDALIGQLITTAREYFDGPYAWFARALMPQTWDLMLPCFPLGPASDPYAYNYGLAYDPYLYNMIELPLPPLQSVTSILYVDPAGVTQTLAPSAYTVDTQHEPGRIMPVYGTYWPTTRYYIPNAVTVRFVAGYADAKYVPQDIRTWLMNAVTYLHMNREAPALPDVFLWSMARYKITWPL